MGVRRTGAAVDVFVTERLAALSAAATRVVFLARVSAAGAGAPLAGSAFDGRDATTPMATPTPRVASARTQKRVERCMARSIASDPSQAIARHMIQRIQSQVVNA